MTGSRGPLSRRGTRKVSLKPAPQPDLPPTMPGGQKWPKETRKWWRTWKKSPIAAEFTALEWDELLVAAILHGRVWSGDSRAGTITELRYRVAKFGVATPADRQRLGIEPADEPAPAPVRPKRDLRLIRDA